MPILLKTNYICFFYYSGSPIAGDDAENLTNNVCENDSALLQRPLDPYYTRNRPASAPNTPTKPQVRRHSFKINCTRW